MKKKIVKETNIKKVSIENITNNFRVFLGPFKDLNLIKKAFDDMNIINFENLEIIRNEKIFKFIFIFAINFNSKGIFS